MKTLKLLSLCFLTLGCASGAQAADTVSQGKHLLIIDTSALATLNALMGISDGTAITQGAGSVSTSGTRGDSSGCDQPGNADSSASAHHGAVTGGGHDGGNRTDPNSGAGGSIPQPGSHTTTLSWQSLLPGSIQ